MQTISSSAGGMNLTAILAMSSGDDTGNVRSYSQVSPLPNDMSDPSSAGRGRSSLNAGIMNRKCAYCDRRFSKAEHLKRHQRSHTGEKPFQCTVCLKSYARSDVLIRHTRNHHSDVLEDDFTETTIDKPKTIKSPESETSVSMEEEPARVSRSFLPQSIPVNQPPIYPLQTPIESQTSLRQSNASIMSGQQRGVSNQHQSPAQSSPNSQSLHRMNSQHDGSSLIEAAMQAAGPPESATMYPRIPQKPSSYHMHQQVQPQPQFQQPRYPLSLIHI